MAYYLALWTIGLLRVCYTVALCGDYSTTPTNDVKVPSNHAETAKVADIMMSACQDYCISQLVNTDCVISYIPNDVSSPDGPGECSYYTDNCAGGCSTEPTSPGIVVKFSCTALACDSLSSPVNGLVNIIGTPITGDVATYSCNTGYVISGSATSTCDATGSWSNAAPVCNLVDCGGGLSNPVNGMVILPSSTLYGAQANYSCDNGYILNGASIITCSANGIWDAPEPTCAIADCGSLTSQANGVVTYSSTYAGSTASYSCDVGYVISGSATSTCGTNGLWSNAATVCNIIDCGSLSNPVNGSVTLSFGTVYGDLASYSCDIGYTLNGASTTTCDLDGSWDTVAPTCDIVDCGSPGVAPINGQVLTTLETTYQENAVYACATGYNMIGTNLRVCQADGSWSGSPPNCHPVDCGPLSAPNNGSIAVWSGTTFSRTALYSCMPGYVLLGSKTRTCLADSTWDGSPPNCTHIRSIQCQAFLQSPRSKVMVKSYSDVLPGFSLLQTATVANIMRCVRMCMNQLQDACEQPNACLLAKYDVISETCDMYYSDTNGNNVTCNATSQCYTYEYYTYFM